MLNPTFLRSATIVALAALPLAGCRIDENKNGDAQNVKIATPFGGMQVKTNDASLPEGVGLPVYPGAVLVKKNNDHDSSSADVNMSFGNFHLRVKAIGYQSADSPDKISAFYRPALAKYGDVIQCDHNKAVGTPVKTSEGLTCDNNKGNHISVNDDVSSDYELKAGSQQHQHIVAIEKNKEGTKIGLVALELPGKLDFGSSNSKDGDNDSQ